MATVLLVGGAGYVGSVLASDLLGRGYAVRILDRLYFGDHGQAELRDRVELIVGDMRSLPDGALDGIEAVVNVGGPPTIPLPSSNYEMNTTASVALAEACHREGCAATSTPPRARCMTGA